jgi:replicative DNA helicase
MNMLEEVQLIDFSKTKLAEQSLIGAILVNPACLDAVSETLSTEDFFDRRHQQIFAAALRLADSDVPIDLTNISGLIESSEMDYAAQIALNCQTSSNARSYAEAVKNFSRERQMLRVADYIAGLVHGEGELSEKIDMAQEAVLALGEALQPDQDLHVASAMAALFEEWDRRSTCDGSLVGLSTGFRDIDKRLSGLSKGDLIIVAGRPSMGKTTFAMNIAEHVAVEQSKPVLVFSMEMTKLQLLDRAASSIGRIPFELLRSGQIFKSEHNYRLIPAAKRIKDSKLYIDQRGALTIGQMRSAARKLNKKTPLALIVVDYLQLARAKADGRVNEVTAISQGLKALAKEINVPVIALSQLNRKCEERGDKRPINADLRDSGAIEQDADVILMLYRDEFYNADTNEKGIAEVACTKQRNGPIGIEKLHSRLEMCRFDDLSHEYKPQPIEPIKKRGRGFDHRYDN